MPHVTGVGGVFFKAKGDPKALTNWYETHLGIKLNPWGTAVFRWAEDKGAAKAATAWQIDASNSQRYLASESSFVINYRVEGLHEMIANLKKASVKIVKEPESSEFGTFASILDPEGNRIELWEP